MITESLRFLETFTAYGVKNLRAEQSFQDLRVGSAICCHRGTGIRWSHIGQVALKYGITLESADNPALAIRNGGSGDVDL